MIDIKEFQIPKEILEILLLDRTTGNNILWGTDQYGYNPKSSIQVEQILSGNVIKPRVLKSQEDQKSRTDSKAEVYTPIEIIKKMNDSVDEKFDGTKREYIKRKVLEVTCGEAPYLVSRYDVSTGKMIPLSERQGLLDRKMRIIKDYTTKQGDWCDFTGEAIKSTYGYEWQGDSLLLARENILYGIIDWYEEKFQEEIPYGLMKVLAEIISYNIFQMDGVTMCVPYSDTPVKILDWDKTKPGTPLKDSMERFDGQPEELSLF